MVTRYTDGSKIVLWAIHKDASAVPVYSTTRRYINSSSFAKIGDDSEINLGVKCKGQPSGSSSTNGYVSLACIVPDDKSVDQLFISIFISSLKDQNDVKTVQITANVDKDITYEVQQTWFQDDYFYIAFTSQSGNNDQNIYLQGFKATDPTTKKFSSNLKLNTILLTNSASAKCSHIPGSGSAFCMWRQDDKGKIVGVEINIGSGTAKDEVEYFADSDGTKYTPAEIIAAQNYYVIFVNQQKLGVTTKFSVRISSAADSLQLPFTLPNLFNSVTLIDGTGYFDGWFMAIQESSLTSTKASIQRYTSSAETNGTQLDLFEGGSFVQGFSLPDQSYSILAVDSSESRQEGYIGQVFDKISNTKFGHGLGSFFIGVFVSVACLFTL